MPLFTSKPAKPGKRLSKLRKRLRRRLDYLRYGRGRNVVKVHSISPDTKRFPRPNFIIIGAPKCGTSWLQRALWQHPDILILPDEIEYFSMHLDYPVEWYLNHFSRVKRESRIGLRASHVLGEKSARYCSIPHDRIRLMHILLPDVRLILMTRDPVARAWSQAKRFFSKRRFNNREGGVLGVPRDELLDYFEGIRPLGEFSVMIANWTDVYPKEQLMIVSQEKSLELPRKAYDAVLAHIGATTDYDPAAIKLLEAETNLGPKLSMPTDIRDYLEVMLGAERDRLHALLGDRTAVYVED